MDNLKQLQVLRSHQSDVTSCDFGPKERLATASRSVLIYFITLVKIIYLLIVITMFGYGIGIAKVSNLSKMSNRL